MISLSQLSRPDKVKVKYKDQSGKDQVRSITPPPTMGDLRSSGQIEQDADIILLMWREDYDLKDAPRIIQVARTGTARRWTRSAAGSTASIRPLPALSPGQNRCQRRKRGRSPGR